MYCDCGTPIGGRVKQLQSIYHYYCPLSERKFNKSKPENKSCEMKRCVHIHRTEELLWNTILEQLTNTNHLKELLNKSISDKSSLNSLVSKQRGKIKIEFERKELELKKIVDGLVTIESKKVLNEFTNDEVYHSLKKQLDKKYREVHVEIENLKNTLKYYGQQDSWYETLGIITNTIKSTTYWTTKSMRKLLDLILDKITLSHDGSTRIHHLDIHLRIPLVISENKKGESKDSPVKYTLNSLNNSEYRIQDGSLYSTVTKRSTNIHKVNNSNGLNTKGFFLSMIIRVSSPNLWLSPYSEYQQKLFDIIREQHEDKKMNFVQISKWMNDNNYLTPRGKVFSQQLAWSMYTKKQRSIKRFSRPVQSEVINSELDIVNYAPTV